MRLRKHIILLLLTAVLTGGLTEPLLAAGPKINIVVRTVLASQDAKFADPRLSDLIRELESVFKYSSYRLLSQNNMTVGMKKPALPCSRKTGC